MNNIEPETVRTVSAEQSNIITSLLVPDKAEQLVGKDTNLSTYTTPA